MAGAVTTLRALQGDTLDLLLSRDTGLGPAHLTRVLDSNPGLAELGPILPLGTRVILPAQLVRSAPATTPVRPLVQLWS
jgi:phage tail protein X